MIFASLLVILFLVFLMFLLVRFTLRSLLDIIEGLKQKEEPSFYIKYIVEKDKISLN